MLVFDFRVLQTASNHNNESNVFFLETDKEVHMCAVDCHFVCPVWRQTWVLDADVLEMFRREAAIEYRRIVLDPMGFQFTLF
jgi:hypothetical protein